MGFYNTGTVDLTNGSDIVTGSGTSFVTAMSTGGWVIVLPDNRTYGIISIISQTSIQLDSNYGGSTDTGQYYMAFPSQAMVGSLTASVNTLLSDFQGAFDAAGSGKFPDGTNIEPSIRATNDQDTGFYFPAANSIGVVTGATERYRTNGNGALLINTTAQAGTEKLRVNGKAQFDDQVFVPLGTQLLPGMGFVGDTDSGIFSDGVGKTNVTSQGAKSAQFFGNTTSFYPAVGTDTVTVQLGTARAGNGASNVDLISDGVYTTYGARLGRDAGANGDTNLFHRGTGSLKFSTDEAAPIIIETNSTERMRVLATGEVVVGATAVVGSELFRVDGAGLFGGDLHATGQILAEDGAAGTPTISFNDDPTTGFYRAAGPVLNVATNGVFHSTFDENGRLGIGTASPDYTLTVAQTADNSGIKLYGYDDHSTVSLNMFANSAGNIYINNTKGTGGGYIIFSATDYLGLDAGTLVYSSSDWRLSDNYRFYYGTGGDFFIEYSITSGGLEIYDVTSNTGIFIKEDTGQVGINTALPDYTLTVAQDADNSGVRIYGYDDHSTASLNLYLNSAGNSYITNTKGTGSGYMIVSASDYLGLEAGTEVYSNSDWRLSDDCRFYYGTGGDFFAEYSTTSGGLEIYDVTANTGIFIEEDTGHVLLDRTTSTLGGGNGHNLQVGSGSAGAGITIHGSATSLCDLQFSDGTVGAQSYAGLLRYEHTTDVFQIWAAAGERMRLNSQGVIIGTTAFVGSEALRVNGAVTVGNGSAAAPSINFTSDPNTGFYRATDGAVDIANNGALGWRFASSYAYNYGQTGTSSSLKLGQGRSDDQISYIDLITDGVTYTTYGFRVIRNSGANASTQMLHRGTGQLEINAVEAAPLIIKTTNLERARFLSGGGLAIGTTTMVGSELLRVNGIGYFDGDLTVAGGNISVGAGGTFAHSNVDVLGNAAGALGAHISLRNEGAGVNTAVRISLAPNTGGGSDLDRTAFIQAFQSTSGGYAALQFGTANSATPTVKMTIKADGTLNLASVPTSSAGLSTGDVWSNSGVLTIV